MLSRTEIRELTFKYIFSTLFLKEQKLTSHILLENFFELNEIPEEESIEIERTVYILNDHYNYILESIRKNLKSDWELERIAKVDLAILFLGATEMIYETVPYKIAINEAVELAKRYGADKSSKFVNGILASIVKDEGLDKVETKATIEEIKEDTVEE